jgi:uncharacterized repeat protein (TIGR03803 family)
MASAPRPEFNSAVLGEKSRTLGSPDKAICQSESASYQIRSAICQKNRDSAVSPSMYTCRLLDAGNHDPRAEATVQIRIFEEGFSMRSRKSPTRLDITLAVVLGFLITASADAMGQERVLHAFSGRDGVHPVGSLIFDTEGNLYGTTLDGGADQCECGTVFQLSPMANGKWNRTVLHRFTGKDGANPFAGLIFDAAGNLYGTTWLGGRAASPCDSYCGVVFELSPGAKGEWTETILHEFNDKDGAAPYAGLIFDAAGNLYGTTLAGGNDGMGTVFKLSSGPNGKWTETVLHSFNGKDGANPYAGVTFDTSGNLYGTTVSITTGASTVFRLSPGTNGKWTHTVLHTFNGKDGGQAYAGVSVDGQGNLYGATATGGAYGWGVIFRLALRANGGWAETILHSFSGKDGMEPYAALIFDATGNLYGTTSQGGDSKSCGCGTVFKLSPDANDKWTETVLHSFNGDDGGDPFLGSVIFGPAANLYGVTNTGGNLACQVLGSNGCGVVFEVRP